MYPENFRYTKEHEWVRVEGDMGAIGITDHAQEELGDIVYVDLPKVGARLEQGKIARIGGIREGGFGHLLAGFRRSGGSERRCSARRPKN